MNKGNSTGSFDTVIVGAGVLGLWAARYAIGEGRSVCILEQATIGSGASGGILGALMSHIPDGWNIKKEFQYQALDRLEHEFALLVEDTGIEVGYRRCGRVMPLAHKGMMSHADSWIEGAKINWHGKYQMEYLAAGASWFGHTNWPQVEAAPFGAGKDDFAARVMPRDVMRALGCFANKRCQVFEGKQVLSLDPAQNRVVLSDGNWVAGGEIIVANGVGAYRLLAPFMGGTNDDQPLGRGVSGQAVMISYPHDDTLPILYQDGVYIVPHSNNQFAIGSTSQNVALSEMPVDGVRFDQNNMNFYERAMTLAPQLREAEIIDRWAGMRPRNTLKGRGADPWFETVPGYDNLIALMGGFKITFGIAHRAMDVARGKIEGPRREKLSWVQ